MFNIKKGELKHFSDADMYLFFEEGMRGGYSETQILFMVMQCLSFFQQVDSNESILKTLIEINTAAIVPKDAF